MFNRIQATEAVPQSRACFSEITPVLPALSERLHWIDGADEALADFIGKRSNRGRVVPSMAAAIIDAVGRPDPTHEYFSHIAGGERPSALGRVCSLYVGVG
ncbi:MAG: hypothetical protein K2P70_07385 [Hyphomonadaceae bacterium]|nr:hypothetical protein [Hyphomonadaceae bacterium]